jgi:adenosylhomocysteine nucleosidase
MKRSRKTAWQVAAALFAAAVLASTLLASLLLSGCSSPIKPGSRSPEPDLPVIVMSAFEPELTNLKASADLSDSCMVDGHRCHLGRLRGLNVILVLSGIGIEQSAQTTRALLDTFEVSAIVFSGIAGGINPNLNIGDVTIPGRWGHADGDINPRDFSFWVPVDTTMLRVAGEISASVELEDCTAEGVCLDNAPRIVTGGSAVSNSFFVDDAEYRELLWDRFQANAVDMETAAVGRVAAKRGVPYIAFRSLSDLAGGGPGANEIDVFFQLAADNAAAVVLAFLEAWAARDAG